MSYFRVMPNTLRAQREELETAYQNLCQDISEIGGVIRQLGTMTSFANSIQALRQTQRKGSEQQAKLRQCASVLGNVADLYDQTEQKNLEGGGTGSGKYYYTLPIQENKEIIGVVRYAAHPVIDERTDCSDALNPGGDAFYTVRKYEPAVMPAEWEPCPMVPNAENCFGMKVVIPQED